MRVLFQMRPDADALSGGDAVQAKQTLAAVRAAGVEAQLSTELHPFLEGFDLIHAFNITRPEETYFHTANAAAQGRPVVLSPIYWNPQEMQSRTPLQRAAWRLRRSPPARRLRGWVQRAAARAASRCPESAASRLCPLPRDEAQAFVLRGAAVILPNAAAEREQLISDFPFLERSRFVVVPNAADRACAHGDAELFAKQFGLRDFILSAARIGDPRKNQVALLKAAPRELPLVFVGRKVPGRTLQTLERLAAARPNTHLLEPLSGALLAGCYAAARVHALPSWYETPGLASLEAALAGCRIVVSDRGTTQEYFGEFAHYCQPDDPASIARAVAAAWQASANPALRERILERCTWEEAARRTILAYEAALVGGEQFATQGEPAWTL
jgi:glycosyltransferase involved in cell wall biosynthesis